MLWILLLLVVWATWVTARRRGRRDVASGAYVGKCYAGTGRHTYWVFTRVEG